MIEPECIRRLGSCINACSPVLPDKTIFSKSSPFPNIVFAPHLLNLTFKKLADSYQLVQFVM